MVSEITVIERITILKIMRTGTFHGQSKPVIYYIILMHKFVLLITTMKNDHESCLLSLSLRLVLFQLR